MIIRENVIEVEEHKLSNLLKRIDKECNPEELIFFDLEHYVYKKPKCVGVFGASVYKDGKIYVTQYMIESKNDVINILRKARRYFARMKKLGKKTIVTFSGNNDFTVINYLFAKYNIIYNFSEEFQSIDIQKVYEEYKGTSIGLKNLEKVFDIHRESEVISGSTLAKTFHKILKDKEYFERMPQEKIDTILLYNEQDVVSLYTMIVNWNKYIKKEESVEEEEVEKDLDLEEVVVNEE